MSFGVTISMTEKTPEELICYLSKMKRLNADLVFTTLRLPGEDIGQFKKNFAGVGSYIRENFRVFAADVSPEVFSYLSLEEIKSCGVNALRIDNGIPEETIAELSKTFGIILNASTIDDAFIENLYRCGYQGEIEAWHNYYPRNNTGLNPGFYEERIQFMKKRGIHFAAFIAGDGERRGTIFEGLPTLEHHRNCPPLLAYLDMKHHFDTETVILGDFDLSDETFEKMETLFSTGSICLLAEHVLEKSILDTIHHNRVDIAADVIRSNEYRRQHKEQVSPSNTKERETGTITIDNEGYGRYMGEMQIVLKDLPKDLRVNVVGRVENGDIPLLSYIKDFKYPFILREKSC